MLYTLRFFFSSKCSLFHNAKLFGSCIIHILYTGRAKIKKNDSGAKGLINVFKQLRPAHYSHISKVTSFGPFTGLHQNYIAESRKETIHSSI